jgi:glycosyltransferase involved in cell wall biosynthesis
LLNFSTSGTARCTEIAEARFVKILHVINTLSAGGAELHLLTLCRYLRSRGADLSVACLREHVHGSRSLRGDFERESIPVLDLDAESRYDWRFLARLSRVLAKERPDILHTHLPRADIAGALVSRFNKSLRFICSVHGIYRDRWFGAWAGRLMRRVYHEAEGVIAISGAVKSWLEQDLGVSGDKVTVIHYGIEPEPFSLANGDLRTEWGLDGSATIGSLGRLEPGKGYDCLIQAMPATLERDPNASLLIAGHDPLGYGKNFQSLIDRLRLNSHVRLVGVQNDVPSFLNALDVFAFASRSEGFGQVLIEAMAAAKPVVASRIPPLTEIVNDGETGLLVNLDDPQAFANAIVWLLTHPEQAKQMGKRGQERVHSHFSAQRMADQTLSLYETLLRSSHYGHARLP